MKVRVSINLTAKKKKKTKQNGLTFRHHEDSN